VTFIHKRDLEKEASKMKRLLALIILSLFIIGCGAAGKYSYKSWDHLVFSAGGYKNCTQEDIDKAKQEGWWGELVPCPVKQ
jgi:ABC-type molybdate transport system substrate-binding protein